MHEKRQITLPLSRTALNTASKASNPPLCHATRHRTFILYAVFQKSSSTLHLSLPQKLQLGVLGVHGLQGKRASVGMDRHAFFQRMLTMNNTDMTYKQSRIVSLSASFSHPHKLLLVLIFVQVNIEAQATAFVPTQSELAGTVGQRYYTRSQLLQN